MAGLLKETVIALVKSALSGQAQILPDDIDFEKLYRFAVSQNIVPLVYYGMVNSGVDTSSEYGEQFFVTTCQYISVAEQQNSCIELLLKEFDDAGIEYIPLKGTSLRELYPKPEMRAMGDADILINVGQYDKIKPIMLRLGFTEGVESDHELVWHRDSVCIELHKRLIPSYNKDYYKYFGDGWNRAKKVADGTRYMMSQEDNLIYLLTHFAKHYRDAGIGIKHLVDIKLYLEQTELDEVYLEQQLKTLKLLDFYNNIKKTINVWFSDGVKDDVTDTVTKVIFSGGAFGSERAHNTSAALKERKLGESKSRAKRFLTAVFLPYKNMCLLFPVLKKLPILLPFLWVWRIIYTAFNKKGTFTKHYSAIKDLTSETISQYEKQLNAVGLDYRFEEDD